MRGLNGRRAIVTGAADGIGAATARRLSAEGVSVIAVDLNEIGLQALAEDIGAETVVADVTAEDTPRRLLDATGGRLDILVNNAGVVAQGGVGDQPLAAFRAVQTVNVDAPFAITQALLPLLKASEAGRIVNIGSIMSTLADVANIAYATSKHAVAGLTKSMALELGPFGITANYIQPGAIVTGMTRDPFAAMPEFAELWRKKAALGRLGTPEDVASAITFLASDDGGFVSGHGLVVDGGALPRP